MVNAVVHGNRYNGRKKVYLKVTRTAEALTVVIGDEGDGFDPTAVPDPLAGENLLRGSGRGVMLMQAFMDEFQISKRAPQGTEVKMVKYKAKAT
jgi:serine/threonine-protein kinase RsbW